MAVSFPWMLVGIALILVFLSNLVWAKKQVKRKKPETSFRMLFYIGVCWMAVGWPIGFAMQEPAYFGFFAMGIFFAIIGLSKQKLWKNESEWGELPADERRFRLMVGAAAVLLVLAGAFVAAVSAR